jgi:acyl dehydratase
LEGGEQVTEDELASLIGRPLPGGTTTITRHRHWLARDTVLSEPLPDDLAHPLFVYLATDAMGVTWDEFFALCGASAADGPMFGEHETEVISPLRVGTTYQVSGSIVSAERKSGRRAGVFDVVGYRLSLTDGSGKVVATTTNSIVFPRRSTEAPQ